MRLPLARKPRTWEERLAGGVPLTPEFVLYSDGNITIGGDVGTDCYTFVTYGYPQTVSGPLHDDAQTVADKCQQLGLPASDSDSFCAEVLLTIPASPPPDTMSLAKFYPTPAAYPLPRSLGVSL